MDVKDKVILITGASEGIGKAAAELLASRGALVAVAARSIDKLNALVATFENGLAIEVDMTQPESIMKMIDAVIEHYGRIDVLINNAGRALRSPIVDIKIPDFAAIMQLNVYGPLLAMQAVIPQMQKQGGGSIVNISSNVSKMSIPMIGAYAATKYALNGITLTARGELADQHIVVSLMHPGQTATNFGANAMKYESGGASRPVGSGADMDTAEDVAKKILEAVVNGPAEQYMSPAIAKQFSYSAEGSEF